MITENYVTLEFPAVPENVEFARTVVACFASQIDSFTLEEVDDVKLVVSEAVSNTVLHSYGVSRGIVRLSAVRNGDVLRVTIEDFGKGSLLQEFTLTSFRSLLPKGHIRQYHVKVPGKRPAAFHRPYYSAYPGNYRWIRKLDSRFADLL
jgi:hypothetical protein